VRKFGSSEPVRIFLESVESLVILCPRARRFAGATMWTSKNRARYERKGLRYESDLTDEEYALIERFLPPERSVSRRSLINAILYVLTTGCQWRQLPKDFPPKSTTHDYFVELQCTGILKQIHHSLYAEVRLLEGRAATPTLAIVDSQTVKSAEKGGQRLIRLDMTRARKSREKNATRQSIRSAS
jgi:transposase